MRLTFIYIIYRTSIISLLSFTDENIKLEGEKNGKYAKHTFKDGGPRTKDDNRQT